MRGILFDKDGTLLDFEATWGPVIARLALEAAGGDPVRAETLLTAGGRDPATGRIRGGSVFGAGTTDLIVALWYGADLPAEVHAAHVARIDGVFHAHGEKHSVAIEGGAAALDLLMAQGFVMGVATNDGEAAAKAALAATGLDRRLAHVFGYDSVPNPKPAPDMVLAFAAATGIAPAEIVVVGDNTHDLAMARAAGAALAIGVTSGNSTAEELAPLADTVLDSIRDLPGWLSRNL